MQGRGMSEIMWRQGTILHRTVNIKVRNFGTHKRVEIYGQSSATQSVMPFSLEFPST